MENLDLTLRFLKKFKWYFYKNCKKFGNFTYF